MHDLQHPEGRNRDTEFRESDDPRQYSCAIEFYLPKTPIPFDDLRSALTQIGMIAEQDSEEIELRGSEEPASLRAYRSRWGHTIFQLSDHGKLKAIAHHFGTEIVGKSAPAFDSLARCSYGDNFPMDSELPRREQLEGLGVRALLEVARRFLHELHSDELWRIHPLATHGSSDDEALDQSCERMEELEALIGRKLVGEEQASEQIATIGGNAIRGFYADLIREQEQELEWLRKGNWGELFRAGKLSEEDYQLLMEDCADGNPWA